MNAIHDLPRRHAITVEEYVRMGEAHVFAQHARLELMDGEIVEMAPIGSAHAAVVNTLDALLGGAVPRMIVSVLHKYVSGRLQEKPSRLTTRSSGRARRRAD